MPLSLEITDDDRPIWGATAISKLIDRNRRQTFHLLETGKIDATKVGSLWVTTPRRVMRSLGCNGGAHD